MPKKNQYKNMFNSVGSYSLAPGLSSQAQASSSSSDGVSSGSVVPSSSAGVSSQPPTKHKDDEDNRDWLVDVLDKYQVTKRVRLKVKDVHNLDNGLRIIVECDEYGAPIEKAAGIIAGVMGQLATNALYFPIDFEKWPDMPNSCMDRVFDEILMPRFFFRIYRQIAKKWAGNNLSKKWREHMHRLWRAAKDPLLSKEEIIRKSPNGIPMDQWALFVNYRMKAKTQVLNTSSVAYSYRLGCSSNYGIQTNI